jgi:hypothetical protein
MKNGIFIVYNWLELVFKKWRTIKRQFFYREVCINYGILFFVLNFFTKWNLSKNGMFFPSGQIYVVSLEIIAPSFLPLLLNSNALTILIHNQLLLQLLFFLLLFYNRFIPHFRTRMPVLLIVFVDKALWNISIGWSFISYKFTWVLENSGFSII